jgi:adenine-specific DNA-methyltransferase
MFSFFTGHHIELFYQKRLNEANNRTVKKKSKATFSKNPVIHRGQDPELFWLNKYDEGDNTLEVDIRTLYRHELISPQLLMQNLYRLKEPSDALPITDLFANPLDKIDLKKVSEYYHHQQQWRNRLIQGDSLLVMTSLLEREGLAGKVQMIYIDPPYGIKYQSNWQRRLHDQDVKDGVDRYLSVEPEQIKAFRDTWELGIHSYLSYLRDRLIVAKELLTESGACFLQICDENLHWVRCVMDEVFGSEHFVSIIVLRTRSNTRAKQMPILNDYILFYAKNINQLKYHKLYTDKKMDEDRFSWVELEDGTAVPVTSLKHVDKHLRRFACEKLQSSSGANTTTQPFEFKGKVFSPVAGRGWRSAKDKLERLAEKNRIMVQGNTIRYKYYFDDFPYTEIGNLWVEQLSEKNKRYIVQTFTRVIQRCIIMTTDPGDLVLDPTCGAGTTAYVAEQWGRRWITIDTSRIALNIAKTRLMTAVYPYYKLHDPLRQDIRQGFVYKRIPRITMKSVAKDEPPEKEILYDQAQVEQKRFRVTGPFTFETLQSFEPNALVEGNFNHNLEQFEQNIFQHLKSAGVKNGLKNEQALFIRVEPLNSQFLHAQGFYETPEGEKKAYFLIGPQFGTVSKQGVDEAIKACRERNDGDWLIILGFSFDSRINNEQISTPTGHFEVTKVRMHDDLLQKGLLKRDKKAASFVTIGEPDIKMHKKGKQVQIEICGLDIYNPVQNQVLSRQLHEIVYWMVDEDYDGSHFIVKQVFFCGGEKNEFKKWKTGLRNQVKLSMRKRAEKTLKIEIDDEAFDRIYGYISHPISIKRDKQKIAVRVISQFGEESTKVLDL